MRCGVAVRRNGADGPDSAAHRSVTAVCAGPSPGPSEIAAALYRNIPICVSEYSRRRQLVPRRSCVDRHVAAGKAMVVTVVLRCGAYGKRCASGESDSVRLRTRQWHASNPSPIPVRPVGRSMRPEPRVPGGAFRLLEGEGLSMASRLEISLPGGGLSMSEPAVLCDGLSALEATGWLRRAWKAASFTASAEY